jgi:hypothetical protein
MLRVLKQIEDEVLKDLLSQPDLWSSLFVNYHKPYVERVFTLWNGYRISLHVIHPCFPEEALVHPHPWPAAFRIVGGYYRTGVGYSDTTELPENMDEFHFNDGALYEMTDPNMWHWVAPKTPVSTIMVNGPLYSEMNPGCKKADVELKSLSDSRVKEILEMFSNYI